MEPKKKGRKKKNSPLEIANIVFSALVAFQKRTLKAHTTLNTGGHLIEREVWKPKKGWTRSQKILEEKKSKSEAKLFEKLGCISVTLECAPLFFECTVDKRQRSQKTALITI